MRRVSFSRRESFIFLNNAARNLNTHNHKHWSHLLFYFSKVSFNIMMGNKGPEWCELNTKKKGRRVKMDKQLLWDTWLWREQRKLGTVVKDVISGKNFSCLFFFPISEFLKWEILTYLNISARKRREHIFQGSYILHC